MPKSGDVLKLYLLINRYLAKEINEAEFCDKFFSVYNITIDVNDLTDIEKKVFDDLNILVNIFFEYKKDSSFSDDYFIIQKLRQKTEDAKKTIEEQDIYENSDKRRLYWLINQYVIGSIDEPTFCDEFYYSYDLEINRDDLNNIEKKVFYELDEVASRFSPFEKDHQLDPKAFFTIDELRRKIIETQQLLKTINYSK